MLEAFSLDLKKEKEKRHCNSLIVSWYSPRSSLLWHHNKWGSPDTCPAKCVISRTVVVFLLNVYYINFMCYKSWSIWPTTLKMQQRQQGGTPESGQLVTHWLYIPGLSTTLAPDCYVPDGDYTVLIFSALWKLWVFHISVFCLCSHSLYLLAWAEISSAVLLCFLLACTPVFLHASSSRPCLPCLPACQPTWTSHPHYSPKSTTMYK